MQMIVANNIKSIIPKVESAKEYMKFVEEWSRSEFVDKSLVGILMGALTTMKFNGSCTMNEHVINMTKIAAKLKSMVMEVNENFLVQFIINSLPSQYALFQMGYNTIKDKWNVHELHNMLIQEEAKLKKQGNYSIYLMGQQRARKNPEKKNGKGKQGLYKVNVSFAQIDKKEHKNDKCYFYKKTWTLLKRLPEI